MAAKKAAAAVSCSFHAHHSPMGAHSSFTCGMFGAGGGMAMESGRPAEGGVLVGYRDGKGVLHYLPLFAVGDSERARYVSEGKGAAAARERIFTEGEIARDYLWATDRLRAPGVSFEVVTPFFGIPDPETASQAEVKFACCPASFVQVSFDNSAGKQAWTGFFALQTSGRWADLGRRTGGDLKGCVSREAMGFATRADVETFIDFNVLSAFDRQHRNPCFLLGGAAGFMVKVPAGEKRRVLVALGYYREGRATFGRPMSYWYTRHFAGIAEVLAYALDNAGAYLSAANERDRELAAAALNAEQKFLIAHATRSYYGSTEWLDDGGRPCWVVNEGEYLMMNTFDLTVDMLFYEMRFNPWTVRNVLEKFVAEYSYYDEVFDPAAPDRLYPGGIAFTHDMGVANHFSPPGHSSYEVSGLDRACFSHMTCEQLVNWILCAGVYVAGTDDEAFLRRHQGTLADGFESLLRRDHPDPARRDGIMKFESSRTWPGGEITTYDSLDHSLGQSRRNLYLAVKSWAAYVALEELFRRLGLGALAAEAQAAAARCAATVAAAFDPKLGFIPAVLDGQNRSAIIPAVEGLVYPWRMGLKTAVSPKGPYGDMVRALRKHLENILVKGVCLYPDGGWKLSSTADNSWASKISLCMYIARAVLGMSFGAREAEFDRAHAEWQRRGATANACSDQFHSGVAKGSLYYPRIVTSVLWLDE